MSRWPEILRRLGLVSLTEYERALSERDRAMQELRLATYRLWEMFERSPIGIVMAQADGRLSRVNEAYCKMLGYSAEEIGRMTFADFTHPDDLALDQGLYHSMLRGERSGYQIKKRYLYNPARKEVLHGDGVIYVQLTVCKLDPGADGVVALGMVEDVTEEHYYYRQMKEQNHDLREKNKQLEALRQTIEMIAFGVIGGSPADVLAKEHLGGDALIPGPTALRDNEQARDRPS